MIDRSNMLAAAAARTAWPEIAVPQDKYPSRPITRMLPYAAGGGTDGFARVFAKREERLGCTIVVDNRPG